MLGYYILVRSPTIGRSPQKRLKTGTISGIHVRPWIASSHHHAPKPIPISYPNRPQHPMLPSSQSPYPLPLLLLHPQTPNSLPPAQNNFVVGPHSHSMVHQVHRNYHGTSTHLQPAAATSTSRALALARGTPAQVTAGMCAHH
jgi:hypothetical protein